MHRARCMPAAAAGLSLGLLVPPLPSFAQQPNATTVLDEIVVTARRREENLQALPLSVAALTADTLSALGLHNVRDIGEFVPNLTLATGERAQNTQMFIRGIGGGNPDPSRAFGTGMYIDGHYIPNSVGGFLSTLNIDRVEVLRGPQGTLYGKNTTGGAINIISAKPGPGFASDLTLRVGDFGRRDVRGMVNLPIADNVYARLAAAHEQSDGYYYNRTLDADDAFAELSAFTGALRFEPGASWTIDTSLTYAKNEDGGIGGQCAPDVEPWSRNRGTWYGDDANQTLTRASCSTDVASGPFVNSSEKRSYTDVETTAAFASALWTSAGRRGALDDINVSLNGSYRHVEFGSLHDRDFSPFAIRAIAVSGGAVPRFTTSRSAEAIVEAAISDRLTVVTGLHIFEEETHSGTGDCYALFNRRFDPNNPDADIPCSPAVGTFFEQTPLIEELLGLDSRSRLGEQSAWNSSVGVFGHVTYALNDRWSLEAGLRYSEDTREFNALEFNVSNVSIPDPTGPATFVANMNADTVIGNGVITEGKRTFGETTPVLSLSRSLDTSERLDNGMIYMRYAEGFLTGGFNTELPIRQEPLLDSVLAFGPEHVHNYEVGFKGSFGGGRWQLNTAIFYMDYTDKQDFVRLDNRDGHLGFPDDSIAVVWNISQVDIYGLELEARTSPWDGGFVDVDLGYLNNEFGEYASIDNDFTALDLSNLAINDLSPEWTLNLRVQHTFGLSNGATLTPMVGAYWQSEYEWLQGLERDAPPSSCFQDSYTKLRARLTYEPQAGNYEVSLFGNNIGDELIFENCARTVGLFTYRYAEPASWGIEFRARWGQ